MYSVRCIAGRFTYTLKRAGFVADVRCRIDSVPFSKFCACVSVRCALASVLHHRNCDNMFIGLSSAMASAAGLFSHFGSDSWSVSFYVHLIFTKKHIHPKIAMYRRRRPYIGCCMPPSVVAAAIAVPNLETKQQQQKAAQCCKEKQSTDAAAAAAAVNVKCAYRATLVRPSQPVQIKYSKVVEAHRWS